MLCQAAPSLWYTRSVSTPTENTNPRAYRRWIIGSVAVTALLFTVVVFLVLANQTDKQESALIIPASAAEFLSRDDNWYGASGPSVARGPAPPLKKVWTIKGENLTGVTATKKMVYVYKQPDLIEAVKPRTGKTSWSFKLEPRAPDSGDPLIRATNSLVYIDSTDGSVYVLEATTGDLRKKIESDFASLDRQRPKRSPGNWPVRNRETFPTGAVATTSRDTIFVTSPAQSTPRYDAETIAPEEKPREKFLFAFDAKDKQRLWSLTALKRRLTVFDEESGQIAWSHEFVPNTLGIWSPAVTERDIYLWKYKDLIALEGHTGRKKWTRTFKSGAPIMPVFTNDHTFIGSKDRLRVYGRDGEEVWSTGIKNSFPPIVGPNFLIVVAGSPTSGLTLFGFVGTE